MSSKLIIVGDGIKVEREITELQMVRVLGVLAGEPVAEARLATSPQGTDQARRQPAISEYLAGLNPESNAGQITAMLLYAADHSGEASLSVEQIKNMFVTARRRSPANIHRDIATAAKRGWIAEEPTRAGFYYVTDTGRKALTHETGPSSTNGRVDRTRGTTSSASGKRVKRSKAETYDLVDLGLDKDKRAALAAFYAQKSPTVQNDQVAVVMYWLLSNTGRKTVSRSEIFTALRFAKARVPARITSVIANLRLAGHLVGDGDELSLHHLGHDMVEQELPRATAVRGD